MRRIGYGLLAFVAVTVGASAARAQTINTPLTQNAQANVQGMLNSNTGSPGASNIGAFTTWAYINSVLKFDVTDSTLDCGVVAAGGSTTAQSCNITPTNAANATAELVVAANAPWHLSINDGASYSSATADEKKSRMTAQSGYLGNFELALAAVNAGNSGADPTDTTSEPPHPNATVTISASYLQSTSTTNDPVKVDNFDNFGNYTGAFSVVLWED